MLKYVAKVSQRIYGTKISPAIILICPNTIAHPAATISNTTISMTAYNNKNNKFYELIDIRMVKRKILF